MREIIIAVSMFPACSLMAQTDWTFQWHGQERGIVFAQTNLTESVKAAIRDDIAQTLSNVAVSDTEAHPVAPDNPDYGSVSGLMNIRAKRHTCPDRFPVGYYRETNGIPYFVLSEEDCALYASAVAQTNQYAVQLDALPSVIGHFTNGFDVANMTLAQKEAYIWNPNFTQMKEDDIAGYEADITEALPAEAGTITVLKPSVLSYSREDLDDTENPLLTCRLNIKINRPAAPEPFTIIFVFKDGAWRWCPEIL